MVFSNLPVISLPWNSCTQSLSLLTIWGILEEITNTVETQIEVEIRFEETLLTFWYRPSTYFYFSVGTKLGDFGAVYVVSSPPSTKSPRRTPARFPFFFLFFYFKSTLHLFHCVLPQLRYTLQQKSSPTTKQNKTCSGAPGGKGYVPLSLLPPSSESVADASWNSIMDTL